MTDTRQQQRRKSDEYGHLEPLFDELERLDPDDPQWSEVRDRLVTGYLPLAEHIAQRFSGKGIAKDDLVQVASVGLIHAVDRFDSSKGADFLSFAVPTVMGEVRRHFRDTTWPMRVPRRLQELRLSLNRAGAELAQDLGRPPTEEELAEHLGITVREVQEGYEARQAFRAVSLDEPPFEDENRLSLVETIGGEDGALELVENHETLAPLLQELPERERKILGLRYFGDMTQTQIAEEVGISQMHVSRLLNRTLNELREELA
ncbi:SigB/SigF/SigG family RNA polymerase sigma factor [Glycomyces algeriensis]|uniref:RNA polymerase sigma factor n=1 Tax=Glycomyces algeriensis TaxID=256037 RepID=A0A9W6LIL3_9ACTN|nr:SigB/SigF/SigG family RNA polymerase sigma factor [Glycomyces algeriensis]MDA1365621.1 SigB/SigF/SigG family RNA polymerase sigma factor [Glycomyces algeriensis]MDR7351309.1 RNA polymerase sigma-B factor [Glycomyces algeriensis]GLI44024.1 RNA polymerase sigma factor [Glycomyces algeriensis]